MKILATRPFIVSFLLFLGVTIPAHSTPTGNATIRMPAGVSEIAITTTDRLAGAIHSLTWNGKEFVDSFDHGRQIQSASNLDNGTPIFAETFNPTEAGSRWDGRGDGSSSRLLHLLAKEERYRPERIHRNAW